jgi:simple sugar transport system permease protein
MIRFVKRERISRPKSVLITTIFLLFAFLSGTTLFIYAGVDPIEAYINVARSFITPSLLAESIIRSIPIMLVSLGLAVAFRMNFWNIGGEGQLYMGMFASTGIVLWNLETGLIPGFLLLPIMFIAAFMMAGLWGIIAAVLRAKLEVNEVLTTIMLNYVAILFVDYLVYGPWKDPKGHGFPLTKPFPESALLPTIPDTRINLGLAVGIVAALLVYLLLSRSKLGFEIRVTGDSFPAAKYAGISYLRIAILVMLISAGLSGIAGLTIVSGIIGRLRPRASPGYGYTGIIVAWISGLNPWLIVPVSILFGGLLVAGDTLQSVMRLPFAVTQIFQALIFIFVIMSEFLKRYKVRIGRFEI